MQPALRAWVFACAALAGCHSTEKGGADAGVEARIERGTRVVVEETAARFFVGQVVDVARDRVRVQTKDGEQSQTVDAADVYRLPPPKALPRADQLAICEFDVDRWVPCRVLRVEDDRVVCVGGEGKPRPLPRGAVIEPTPLTALNLRRYFQRAAEQQRFHQEAAAAGPPRSPAGWRPLPGERVVARRGDSWFSATVEEIEDDVLHLRWRIDNRVTEVPQERVVPEPPYEPGPRRGSFALIRPAAVARSWPVVKVVAVVADGIVVASVEGERRVVPTRDVLPLE